MSKRQELKDKRRRQKSTQRYIWLGLIAVVAVVFIILVVVPLFAPRPETAGLTEGDPNAPVKVEEFSDFQCPSCQYFFQNTKPQLVEEYINTGKVQFTYVPVAFIGNESFAAANAAYCANEQDRFWDYHDMLFNNQAGENVGGFSDQKLVGFADTLGLDRDAFQTCLASKKYNRAIQENVSRWNGNGLNQTPSFLVNGEPVLFDGLQTAIEQALANQ